MLGVLRRISQHGGRYDPSTVRRSEEISFVLNAFYGVETHCRRGSVTADNAAAAAAAAGWHHSGSRVSNVHL